MIVSDIGVVERERGVALRAKVRSARAPSDPFELQIFARDGQGDWLAATGDPFVPALLQCAMARNEDLVIDGAVSSQLLGNLRTIMEIYRAWRPGLSCIEVRPADTSRRPRAAGCALFFSGGVDSFYSLLKHEPSAYLDGEVSHLLLVFGFDIKLSNPTLFAQVATRVADIARRSGKSLVVVETNVRAFSDPIVTWDLYHGGPMASVGLALGGMFGRVLIASTYAYQELHPWGSHPLVDPLWSTEALEFIHDGCEATRLQKVRSIASSDLALSSLRVCWRNDQTEYNCGHCEKCLRTMLGLYVAGALQRCGTFTRPLSAAAVRFMHTASESSEIYLRELLEALGKSRRDRQLARALRWAIYWRKVRSRVGAFLRRVGGARATMPGIRQAIRRVRPG